MHSCSFDNEQKKHDQNIAVDWSRFAIKVNYIIATVWKTNFKKSGAEAGGKQHAEGVGRVAVSQSG